MNSQSIPGLASLSRRFLVRLNLHLSCNQDNITQNIISIMLRSFLVLLAIKANFHLFAFSLLYKPFVNVAISEIKKHYFINFYLTLSLSLTFVSVSLSKIKKN